MNIAILRSIPLAKNTREAWTSAGARIVPRKLLERYVHGNVTDDDTIFINLGIRHPIQQDKVINPLEVIQSVSRPADIRKTLGQFLPPPPEEGEPYWVKRHGYGGDGKAYYSAYSRTSPRAYTTTSDDKPWSYQLDVQRHISGLEYRVNTVGSVVVQAHRKEGHENWEWVGVEGVRKNGIIPLLKAAVEAIPHGYSSTLGWDIIVAEDKPYVLEANTSAGVNEPTARRILGIIMDRYNS
jgi:hypothetical protein